MRGNAAGPGDVHGNTVHGGEVHGSEVHAGTRRLGLLLLTAYLTALLWISLHSTPTAWLTDANLSPFASVRAQLAAGTERSYLDLLGSLLGLAPLGVLLPLAGGQPSSPLLGSLVRTVFAGVLVATGLEALRTTLNLQLLNVDDILLAALGVALTHLTLVPVGRAVLRHRLREAGAHHADPRDAAGRTARSRSRAPERDPETNPEITPRRTPGPARVRIVGAADATAFPAREA